MVIVDYEVKEERSKREIECCAGCDVNCRVEFDEFLIFHLILLKFEAIWTLISILLSIIQQFIQFN